jgi:hypothetical protein
MKAKGNDQSQAFGTKKRKIVVRRACHYSMNASRKDSYALVLSIARIQNM